MKIKKVFSYMGNKGKFYREIKEIFEKSKKKKFVDLFAGGLEVPANLYIDVGADVFTNVKDTKMEYLIKLNEKNRVFTLFEKAVVEVYKNIPLSSTRNIYNTDKATFKKLKENYLKLIENVTEEEREVLILLGGVAGKSKSLSSNFYSEQKIKKLKDYLEVLKKLDIKTEFFNEKWQFSDSFIFLDPPYLLETGAEGKKGFNYEGDWTEKDDVRLVNFIKSNLGKNNIFMIFGSLNNNLQHLIKENFPAVKFEIKKYKRSFFGCSSERAEWYCLIN